MADEIKELRRRIRELKEKSGDTEPGPFVAGENSKHFHRPDCKWAAHINPKYMQMGTHTIFLSHKTTLEILGAGLRN
jgi:hypothetical protein